MAHVKRLPLVAVHKSPASNDKAYVPDFVHQKEAGY